MLNRSARRVPSALYRSLSLVGAVRRWMPPRGLACSALSAVAALLLLVPAVLFAAEESGGSCSVYLGTYTRGDSQGVYHCRLDLETGRLSQPRLVAELENPSFLALHPTGKYLYAVSEVGKFEGENAGAVASFSIEAPGKPLRQTSIQSTRGSGPCHLVVDKTGSAVLVANYGGGSVAALPLDREGRLGPASAFIQHTGSSVDPRRQNAPHAHCVRFSPDNRFALAADLGLDKILVYRFDAERVGLEPHETPSASVQPGAGPRHFTFHPSGKYAYVINEMASTVTAFHYDAARGVLTSLQTLSTLPDGFTGSNSTAEVQVEPAGRFLYGSNRGHDSIAVFAIDQATGRLTRVENEPTGGRTPRNFGIHPTGRFLLAANQSTNNVVVFRRDAASGQLEPTGHSVDVPSPVCVLFAEQR